MIPGFVLADAAWSGPPVGSGPVASVAAGPAPSLPVDTSLGLSALGPLALVSLLLIFALVLLRYLRLGRNPSQAGLVSVVSQTALSPSHTVYLVQAAGRYLLLGGAPGGLSLLAEVPAAQLPSQKVVKDGRMQPPSPTFGAEEEDEEEDDLPAMVTRSTVPPIQPAEPPGR